MGIVVVNPKKVQPVYVGNSTRSPVFAMPGNGAAGQPGLTTRRILAPNTFTFGDIIYARPGDVYGLASISNTNNYGTLLVLAATSTSFELADQAGLYTISGHGFGPAGTILFLNYLADGKLTATVPPVNQFIVPLIQVFSTDTFFYQPVFVPIRRTI